MQEKMEREFQNQVRKSHINAESEKKITIFPTVCFVWSSSTLQFLRKPVAQAIKESQKSHSLVKSPTFQGKML